ncbi:MAG: ASCH domain-containing protein [Eubacterium sp.]|nr:ASCH domain-containing protein [Eubacterium sp.]
MKPILFNTSMVNAIRAGRKTVTRRVIKPRYREGDAGFWVLRKVATGEITGVEIYDEDECGTDRYVNPPYQVGDVLYVRETYAQIDIDVDNMYFENSGELYRGMYIYKADGVDLSDIGGRWHPSIHMPKEAARIFLRVTDVRVEQLQDITIEEVHKEGIDIHTDVVTDGETLNSHHDFSMEKFETLWDSIIQKNDLEQYGWNANPWVWVIEFEKIEKPEVKDGKSENK